MVELWCIFLISLLGKLLSYLLWNIHLDYLLLIMIYIWNLIEQQCVHIYEYLYM
jgi:hypothetical protein